MTFVFFAIFGLILLIISAILGKHIVKISNNNRIENDLKPFDDVKNMIDFFTVSKRYIAITGKKGNVYLAYSLSTFGSILFVYSLLKFFIALNLPK